jgi:hypothetical protein
VLLLALFKVGVVINTLFSFNIDTILLLCSRLAKGRRRSNTDHAS